MSKNNYYDVILTFHGFTYYNPHHKYYVTISDDPECKASNVAKKKGSNVYVVTFRKADLERDPMCALGTVLHELMHTYDNNVRDFDPKEYNLGIYQDPITQLTNNIMVDHNIENKGIKGFPRATRFIEKMRKSYLSEFVINITDALVAASEPAKLYVIPVVYMDYVSRNKWMPGLEDIHKTLMNEIEKHKDIMDQYKKIEHLQERYDSKRDGGKPNYELIVDIMKALEYENPDPEYDDSDGDGDGSNEDLKEELEKLRKAMGVSDHDEDSMDEFETSKISTPDDMGDLVFPDLDNIRIVREFERCQASDLTQCTHTLAEINKKEINKLRKILSSEKDVDREDRKWTGIFTGRSVNKAMSMNAPFFKRRKPIIDTSAAVYILVDCSGSMHGRKHRQASVGCALISEALNIDGVELEMAGFTTHGSRPHHYLIKAFDDVGIKSPETIMSNLMSVSMGNNDDDAHVLYAVRRLMGRDKRKKILIVLSDGEPAGHRDYGLINRALKDTVKMAEDMGMHVLSLGIEDESVRRFYTNWTLINNVKDLPEKLLELALKTVRN